MNGHGQPPLQDGPVSPCHRGAHSRSPTPRKSHQSGSTPIRQAQPLVQAPLAQVRDAFRSRLRSTRRMRQQMHRVRRLKGAEAAEPHRELYQRLIEVTRQTILQAQTGASGIAGAPAASRGAGAAPSRHLQCVLTGVARSGPPDPRGRAPLYAVGALPPAGGAGPSPSAAAGVGRTAGGVAGAGAEPVRAAHTRGAAG